MAIQNAYKRIKTSLLLFSALFLFTTCIKDDLDEDCRIQIHFDYSYNMTSANRFGEQVDQVSLYVFDENDTFIQAFTERGDHVSKNDFAMTIPLYNGKYQFVVFAQNNKIEGDKANFKFPTLKAGQSRLDDLTATLKRAQSTFDGQLNNLLVGYHNTIHIDYVTNSSVTIQTKKITNTVRVILVDRGVEEVNQSTYSLAISDEEGSGIVKYDYTVVPDGFLNYLPYWAGMGTEENTQNQLQSGDNLQRTVVNEFSLSQIDSSHKMRLVIKKQSTGGVIMDANFFALLRALFEVDSQADPNWTFQEYIDREDLLIITLYTDTKTWLDSTLIINGWVINNIQVEF
ncbi:FimB/Mfa2 family fimbrial subunit [Massilibacteroides vaginae]|uniref:FimB/Mfa2 family fimbrial subunit n=1 Tax=Massilibacteroides vaginae TaxID=1673718 RepID=UPI000A1CA87E|nr:FimB/Mfa2 family fimbrial subunit [Massilibacteroides vaginae]